MRLYPLDDGLNEDSFWDDNEGGLFAFRLDMRHDLVRRLADCIFSLGAKDGDEDCPADRYLNRFQFMVFSCSLWSVSL